MRFRLAFALTAITTALGAYLAACSSEDKLEDLCGWLGDANNCYRQFYADITTTCGTKGLGSGRDGSFLKRDKLDTCVLDGPEGGQVIFDPPLDVADFPITTGSFAMIRGDGTVCGAAAFGADGAMALSIEPVSISAEGIVTPLGDGGLPDSGTSCIDSTDPICGGSFSVKPVTEREIVDVTCSTATRNESHRFNRLQRAKCDGTIDNAPDETNVAALFPRAEFESNAGGVALEGYVLFRAYFPPATGAARWRRARRRRVLPVPHPERAQHLRQRRPGRGRARHRLRRPLRQGLLRRRPLLHQLRLRIEGLRSRRGRHGHPPLHRGWTDLHASRRGRALRREAARVDPLPRARRPILQDTSSLTTNVVLPRRSRSLSRSCRRSPGTSFCSFRNVPLRELSSSTNA